MTLEEAKELLNQCTRHECRDHAFSDREIYFTMGAVDVAEGYAGGGLSDIVIYGASPEEDARFNGNEADELFECGAVGGIERNDSTGPDEYQEGECMPGLTLEGVLDELTTPLVDLSRPIGKGHL